MQRLCENMDQEKERQLSKLQQEIKRRREKKQAKRKRQLDEEETQAAKTEEEMERQGLLEVNQEQAHQLERRIEQVRPSTPVIRRHPVTKKDSAEHSPARTPRQAAIHSTPVSSPTRLAVPVGLQLGEREISQLIMSTPLFGQLSEIESLLQHQLSKGRDPGAVTMHAPGEPYIDLRDAQWECKGDLVPIDIQSLKPSDFVVYRFGVFVSQLLRAHNHLPEVTILVAANLPPNNYSHNCFRNSFFFEHSRRILFIRRERLESVGEFVLVILHCLAHIKAGDLANDHNPLFLREFYQVCLLSCHLWSTLQ